MSRLLAGALAVWWAAGCASPIVGAECRDGLEVCDGRCVDLLTDPLHCGGCGVVCAEACVEGVCVGEVDGGVADGGQSDGEVLEAGPPDGGLDASIPLDGDLSDDAGSVDDGSVPGDDAGGRDGGTVLRFDGSVLERLDGGIVDRPTPFPMPLDAGRPDADPCGACGELACCAGACVDVTSDDAHCGGCGMPCAPDDRCELGACVPRCEEPTTWCGACVVLADDPDHCGGCGRRCPSGLCADGVCLGAPAGHVVLVGHSYAESRLAIRQIVGNAVWLAVGAEIDVVVYEGDASAASRREVDRAIDEGAGGRVWRRAALRGGMADALAEAEVFVVHAQRMATDDALRSLGVAWATELDAFLLRGGIVVVLDGEGDHAGTWQLLETAGLLSVGARVQLGPDPVSVVQPGDAVAARLPSRYRAERASVAFVGTSPGETVVAHELGAVVLHRVVMP